MEIHNFLSKLIKLENNHLHLLDNTAIVHVKDVVRFSKPKFVHQGTENSGIQVIIETKHGIENLYAKSMQGYAREEISIDKEYQLYMNSMRQAWSDTLIAYNNLKG